MIVLITNKQNIITNIYAVNNAKSDFLEGLTYKIFDQTSAYQGLNIKAVNEDGSIKTRIEQIELGLDSLKENEEIIDGEIVVKKEDTPANTEIPNKEKTLDQIISQKQSELQQISSEYLKADILGFENTKTELKKQYLDLSTELETLQNNK
ncbi:MAG: hypothetical protein ACRCTJ_02890 [Brevinema sp.]